MCARVPTIHTSWDRQPFLTTVRDGTPSMTMATREIHHNFFIDNYSPQENVDNDDGSSCVVVVVVVVVIIIIVIVVVVARPPVLPRPSALAALAVDTVSHLACAGSR